MATRSAPSVLALKRLIQSPPIIRHANDPHRLTLYDIADHHASLERHCPQSRHQVVPLRPAQRKDIEPLALVLDPANERQRDMRISFAGNIALQIEQLRPRPVGIIDLVSLHSPRSVRA